MEYRQIGISLVVGALIGGGLVRHYATETTTVTKEVVKNNVITVTHEVVKPDGTKVVDTTTTDKSTDSKKATVVETKAPKQLYTVHVGIDSNRQYFGGVSKQVLGPLSVGLQASQNGTLGVMVGFSF
jgi:hypothetical protein